MRYRAVTGGFFQQASAMIDPDAQRRAVDAAVETDRASARAPTAAEACDLLRADMRRLRQEVLVISSIAAELFPTLPASGPGRAVRLRVGVVAARKVSGRSPFLQCP